MSEGAQAGTEAGSLLLNQPVVIDNGSSTLKAGFAGGSKPKVSSEWITLRWPLLELIVVTFRVYCISCPLVKGYHSHITHTYIKTVSKPNYACALLSITFVGGHWNQSWQSQAYEDHARRSLGGG